jgi:2-oxoglutarate dehydrogenase E1 component
MNNLDIFHGPNAAYVLDLYETYRSDPDALDPQTRTLFERWSPSGNGKAPPLAPSPLGAAGASAIDVQTVVLAARVTRLVRELGHLAARIDPLGTPPPGDPALELETYGLTTADMEALPPSVVSGPLAVGAANALEALGRLRQAYSGSVGYEDDQVQVPEEREWLRDAVETGRFFQEFDAEHKREVLRRLTEVETLELFLDVTYNKKKRFSIEGVDMLVPMLDQVIHDAVVAGTREIVMGMAHRGRLSVLASILNKPYAAILSEFEHHERNERASVADLGAHGYTGDVKYHKGAQRAYSESGLPEVPITLAPNPSHLEFVNPVVMGRARAAQERRDRPGKPRRDLNASLDISIHGDAAFPGQGIVAETLNLSQLSGYRVGGTIHIITNNQIGFTTLPNDSRSTLYASDLAKGFEIPIVHVNADDPVACIAVAKMAFAYRQRFGKDFLIDLVGYRRYGHNEGDNPSFTQPRMYEVIKAHPRVREIWALQLENEGVVTRDEADAMVLQVREELQAARKGQGIGQEEDARSTHAALTNIDGQAGRIETAVPEARLRVLNDQMLVRPEGFTADAKLERILQARRLALDEPNGINWGHAEALAFAAILGDGTPIRLTGQDSQRGTFSHRNAFIHDPTTGEKFCPFQAIPAAKASFAVYNSPLSENACLGFEYGYSMHATRALVLWEAQFGDFANGAQVIIDQFLVSGQAKWQQTPSLVMLLPHGYEGQGPEHSSARLERYLQLGANDNIRIVNCTSAAQYFHVLRRQAATLAGDARPLIVLTPKSLLREPLAGSSLSELTSGEFQPVIDDAPAADRRDRITRLVLCSGKIYVDLSKSPLRGSAENVAVARIEELYPFHEAEVRALFAAYPALQEVAWVQEEPANMGAWNFIALRLPAILPPNVALSYVGRPDSASPAEGVEDEHIAEQARIVSAALSGAPAPKIANSGRPAKARKNGVTNGR